MGKDFTPVQSYLTSMQFDKDFTFFESLKIVNKDGERSVYTPEEISVMKKYEYLSRTSPDVLTILLKDNRMDTIEFLNNEIKKIIDKEDDVDPTIGKWFFGRLDPAFYYNEYNNQLLMEYLNK